nr:universal stress protein [Halopolyspora algeriensis]
MWTATEAAARAGDVDVVHAYYHPEVGAREGRLHRDRGEHLLHRAARACHRRAPESAVRTHLIAQPVVPALLAQSHDADLLVTADRGSGGFTGLMVGSVSTALATRTDCPLLVLRTGSDNRPRQPRSGPIVMGLDDTGSGALLDTAARRHAGMVVVGGGRSASEHHVRGSTRLELLKRAPCAVSVLHG